MTNLEFNILVETLHAAIIGTIFFFLWIRGRQLNSHQKYGWQFILAGFGLFFCGTLLDITDNFPTLNRFIIIGDTRYEAFLEKVIGYGLGSILLAIGFWKFLPAVLALRENESRLRTSEDRFRKIIEHGPISMAIVAMDGTIEYINRRAVETFGYQNEDIPNMDRWWSVAYPDETYRAEVVAQWMSLFEKALVSAQEIERREYRVTCKSGTIKTMVIFGVLVADKCFVMFEDITERKMAEERLRASENRYQIFASNSSDFVYSCTARGMEPFRIKWLAGAIEPITGYTIEEMLRKSFWLTIVHPEDKERVGKFLMELVPGERAATEFRIITKAGDVRWIHDSRYCESRDEDELFHYGSSQDITARKLAEMEILRLNSNLEGLVAERTTELVRSNRDLASFCYAISHELRAPVARLKGLSQALQEELLENPAEAAHCAQRIMVASSQMQQVIDSVLQLSRLSQAAFVPQLLNVSAMVREVATNLVNETDEHKVVVVIAEDITTSGDSSLVRLCLENLLGNAMKYTVRQPVARIEFGRDAATGALFVRDNGIGFDMNHAENLFEPFNRLHSEKELAGSGIGLATVQRIIERHGGKIRAESVPGQGTTFFFTLSPVNG